MMKITIKLSGSFFDYLGVGFTIPCGQCKARFMSDQRIKSKLMICSPVPLKK